jgi:uncharacterized protein involved in propanediol utilization
MPCTPVTVPGHFGEWIQGRLGPDGPVALITLACPALSVRAPGAGLRLPVLFDAPRLEDFAVALGLGKPDWPALDCDMPLGAGAGASTACLAVEGASDPLMHTHPDRLLWASRRAEVLRDLPSLPEAEIVGGLWGAPERTDPRDEDFPDISDLVAFWSGAAARGDLAAIAGIATESARRSTAHRGPSHPMSDLARELGALGYARAHTGPARALIFAPGKVPGGAGAALQEAGLRDVLRFRTGGAA